MPRVFMLDPFGEDELDDEALDALDEDPYAVPPEAFRYLPAPDMGGPRGPIYVPVRPGQPSPPAGGQGFFARLLGGPRVPQSEWEVRAKQEAAEVAARLAGLGAVRAYCRYDGGHDEGFAWFDHCAFADGSVRDADRIARDLGGVVAGPLGLHSRLEDCAGYWAVELLGRGFGTGEYTMYGAFTVDLATGLVADDPNPAPIVQNIQLKTS